jgi:nucleoside-diphosphate-sugar epimerase
VRGIPITFFVPPATGKAYLTKSPSVHGIVHLASPVTLAGGDPKAIIGAATNGTRTILQSAYSCAGPQLSRFILASSIASLMRTKVPPNYVFREQDWSPFTEKLVQRMGPELNQLAYFASKPIAERGFWEFIQTHKVSHSIPDNSSSERTFSSNASPA